MHISFYYHSATLIPVKRVGVEAVLRNARIIKQTIK